MKSLNEYLSESLQDITAEVFQYCLDMGDDVDDLILDDRLLKDRFDLDLTEKERQLLVAFTHYGNSSLFPGKVTGKKMYALARKISDRRIGKFIGAGSEGIAFDAGDYIIKIITTGNSNALKALRRWADTKDLKTIVPVVRHDKDFKWIATPKLITPCPEGQYIQTALDILYSPQRSEWENGHIDLAKTTLGDNWEWISKWLDDFCDDYKNITGKNNVSDDLRSANIGKTRDGKVLCFDWYDPYCDNEHWSDEEFTKDDMDALLARIAAAKAAIQAAKAAKKPEKKSRR